MSPDISRLFSEHFRNGLVHEARIKNGGEFSLDTESTVESYGESLRINPKLLYKEVENAFNKYLTKLDNNETSKKLLIDWNKVTFEYELNN